jgi:hypothetical protein
MVAVTDGATAGEDESAVEYNFTGSAAVALLIGAGLAWSARTGAVQLLVAVAVVQALLAVAWEFGLRLPGRIGALVLAALASAAADIAVSVWPHSRLGTLLAVLGLAVPVLFVHQLSRGAARVRIVESLGGIALLVLAEVSLPALVQLRHEFLAVSVGGDVVFGVVVASSGALVVGYLTDLVSSAPRFDGGVPRGLLAVIASAAAGAALGQLTLRNSAEFAGGRGLFAGAALGAIVALFAVAIALIEYVTPLADSGFGRRVRPVLGVVFPLCMLAPVAFLLCLAIRA